MQRSCERRGRHAQAWHAMPCSGAARRRELSASSWQRGASIALELDSATQSAERSSTPSRAPLEPKANAILSLKSPDRHIIHNPSERPSSRLPSARPCPAIRRRRPRHVQRLYVVHLGSRLKLDTNVRVHADAAHPRTRILAVRRTTRLARPVAARTQLDSVGSAANRGDASSVVGEAREEPVARVEGECREDVYAATQQVRPDGDADAEDGDADVGEGPGEGVDLDVCLV